MKQFYFTNEAPEDIFNCIDFEFSVTHSPWVTVITLKNGIKHYGFLHHYPDSDTLAKEFKFHIVIQNRAMKFREDRDNNNFFNPDCSEIVYAGDVTSIELVNALDKVNV